MRIKSFFRYVCKGIIENKIASGAGIIFVSLHWFNVPELVRSYRLAKRKEGFLKVIFVLLIFFSLRLSSQVQRLY